MTLALYGKSRRRQWMLVALALFALLGAFSAALAVLVPTKAASVTPTFVEGNPTCQGLGYDNGFKPNPPAGEGNPTGTYNVNGGTITVTENGAGTGIDWSSTFSILAVIVKGGPNANVYTYAPGGSMADTGLVTPTNPSNETPFGLSHVVFCWDDVPTGNIIVGKVIDPSSGVAPADSTTFGGTIVGTGVNKTWSGVGFASFSSPISATAGVQLTVDENSPTNGWSEVGWAAGSLDTQNNPVCPADKESYTGSNVGVNLLADQTQVVCVMNTKQGDTPTRVLEVCKHVESDSAAGGVFTIEVQGQTDFVTTNLAPGDDACTTFSVEDGAEITITETGFPSGWTNSSGYPQVDATGVSPTNNTTITVTVGTETCEPEEEGSQTSQTTEVVADCTVTFYNKTDGQVSPTGDLRIEKYLDINGDGDAADVALGEGPIAGWNMTVSGPDVNGVFPTGAGGSVSFSGLNTGDNYAVTEALPAGWVLTNVKVDGANSAVNVTKNVTIPDGTTRVVAYYNQPLGSLNVHKDAVTSHNGGPNVPAPQDDDGWTITVSSAACGINQSKQTDASGNASFTGLPLCTDYVVSENTLNADSPGFAPISATSVAGQTPSGQTVTFVNRRVSFDPPCQDCIQIIPTPTPTTPPPTATPTNTVVPPAATPTPEEATEGEKTPGPTPIAPSTGTGGSGGSGSMNILLLALGLAVLGGGMSLAAAGRRRRN